MLATALADDDDDVAVSLDRGSHAVQRVLWHQRFFEQAIGAHHDNHTSCLLVLQANCLDTYARCWLHRRQACSTISYLLLPAPASFLL